MAEPAHGTAVSPVADHPFLRMRGLTVGYGPGAAVLSAVSLDVSEGEFVSILGPSGCGKTTLLKAVAGFIPVSAGRLEVDGKNLLRVPPAKRDVGFVFQNYALFPHMTVRDNVGYGLASRRVAKAERRARVAEMLDLVGLAPFGARRPGELSGGQQQRVAIARALAIRPRLLLMDEPLSNLDAKLRVEMREELRALQRRVGVTTLFVTHDQEEAMTISDRLVLLNEGVVEQAGAPQEVYGNPRTDFVADFLGGGNIFRGRVATDGRGARLEAGDLSFAVPDAAAGLAEVTVVVREDRVTLTAASGGSDPNGSSRFPATVEQAAFLGMAWRYRLRLHAGRVIHAVVSADAGVAFPEGAQVVAEWGAGNVTVVGRS